jgi:POT family proton-dependent oligopeptide transporter
MGNHAGERKSPEMGMLSPTPTFISPNSQNRNVNTETYINEEGNEHPSEEDMLTLRRVSDKIPFKAFTIAFVELTERMSYYGTIQVFTNFIARPRQTPTGRPLDPYAANAHPGALGMHTGPAFAITTFNSFWVYMMPLFGAYVADTYWGRYKTIAVAVLVAVIGHTVLVLSAIPSVLDNPKGALGAFMIGILIMGVGTGGFKPNISPLIAEQIPNEKIFVQTTKKGERVIVDPAVTITRVYNWFYLFINIGALAGQMGMVQVERFHGFYMAFLIPTIAFATVVPAVLFFCRNWYKHTPPAGSILPKAVKMLSLGAKGRWHLNPIATYRHMNDGTFWEDIKPSKFYPGSKPQWMDFDDLWVDELRRGYSACTVFLWYPLYWLTYNQLNNNLTTQAATMDLHGITNDVISNLDPFALMILIPFCDLLFYPWLLKNKIRFTPLKRITAGFLTGAAAMIYTTVVQYYM